VVAETSDYRESMNTIQSFINDRCEVKPGATVSINDLYEAFREWSERNGETVLSKKAFGMRLDQRSQFPKDKGANGTRFRRGLTLRN
jgi:phage/plasmid-associated DNA primase